jgi:hypothetical protein
MSTTKHELPAGRMCTRCVLSESFARLTFDSAGVCNYCHDYDRTNLAYPTGAEGKKLLDACVREMKEAGRGKKYDVVIGVSGGCDSTYLMWLAKQYGLRVLAAHFDNTWNSGIATQNLHEALSRLEIDLFTIVVNNEEYDEILRAFLLSGTPDIDAPTDIALASTMYAAAEKFGVGYQWDGHSFRSEGSAPLDFIYMDQRYIQSVVREHGRRKNFTFDTYPTLWLSKQFYWWMSVRIKKIRPLYWLDYDKSETKKQLAADLGWKWYGGLHLENRYSEFMHTYYYPRRYDRDMRTIEDSALIRSGRITREEGIRSIATVRKPRESTVDIVCKRLDIAPEQLEALLRAPEKTYRDYGTYKRHFELLRPVLYVLMRGGYVSSSFFNKYTTKQV